MLKTIIISIALVGLAFLLMGVKVLFVKGGKFPSGHAHSSAELRHRGVGCAVHDRENDGSHHNAMN